MKRIITIIACLLSIAAYGQTPTFRWISGSQDIRERSNLVLTEPGPRQGLSSFTDENGNFWIFGGRGNDFTTAQGFYNDTWKYDRTTGVWEWVDGQMSVDQPTPTDNNSLSFNGIDNIVQLNAAPIDYEGDLTIEVWFRANQDGVLMSHSQTVVENDFQGWKFEIIDNGTRLVVVNDCCEVISANDLNLFDSQWHHLAVTYENGDGLFVADELGLYLDDFEIVEQFRSLVNENVSLDEHATYIGGFRGDNYESYFNGQIDEVRFWTIARNKGEILSNRTIQLTASVDSLSSYYNFNQGVANSAGNVETNLVDIVSNVNGEFVGDIFRDAVFVGEMAKFRTWSSALDRESIQDAARSTLFGNEPNLELAFEFDQGSPQDDNTAVSTIDDLTTVNDGFLSNFALSGDQSNFLEDNLNVIQKSFDANNTGWDIVTADLNNDTYEDVITSNFDPQSISIYTNNQSGELNPFVEHSVGTFARKLTVGHWNADAIPDIAVSGYGVTEGDERVRVFFGDGAGGFSSSMDLTFPIDSEPDELRSADLNDDTNEDLIVLLLGENRVEVHYGDGVGGFTGSASFDLTFTIRGKGMIVDDFNNDDFPDLAFPMLDNVGCGKIGLMLNDQTGAFSAITFPNPGCLFITDMLSTDFNGDGNRDYVFHDVGAIGSVVGNGDGTVGDVVFQPTESFYNSLELSDVNGDNIEDIIAIDVNDNTLATYIGSSSGEFTFLAKTNIVGSAEDTYISDLDKNGLSDIAIVHESSFTSVVLREGDGFSQSTLTPSLSFDGSDDYVQIPNLKIFDGDFTIEGWIKTEDNGPIFAFADSDPSQAWGSGRFALAIKDGRLTFMVNGYPDIEAYSEYSLTNGEWHHIALAVSINDMFNDQVVLYVDGIEVRAEGGYDFDAGIDNSNGSYFSQLGYASTDFRDFIGQTGQAAASNWIDGVSFPESLFGRAFNAYWNDANGDFFIFGGQGENGIFNSVRKYDKNLLDWVTINGEDEPNDGGNFGTIGVADANNRPSARWDLNATTDADGNVWIFGGSADNEQTLHTNDLWKYDPNLNEWTWENGDQAYNMAGNYGQQSSGDPANFPGSRSSSHIWSDSEGYIWLFGGFGYDAVGNEGYLNDLWKYDPGSSTWTWVSGSQLIDTAGIFGTLGEYNDTNYPGGRRASLQWNDSNGLVWIFGGSGIDKFGIAVGYLNDLWSYDPSIDQWAWHSGSDFKGSTGSYNEKGLSSTDYVPGARFHSAGWTDEEDKLWLFGGFNFNQLSTGHYNDFWNYQIGTGEWTWLNGFNSTADISQLSEYGDINEGSSPHPGSRHGALTWTDLDGNFWLLGGAEIGSNTFGFYNDIWKYETQIGQWRYLLGDTELSLNDGVYGAIGIGNSTNDPKSRWHGASWTGDDGKLWFFGGINNNPAINDLAWLNDLWYFDPESNVYTWVGGSSTIDAAGVYGIKGDASTGHIPGARSSCAFWKDSDGIFWLFGGYESFEYNNDLWTFNPNTLEWTWVSGNNFQNSPGIYGEKEVTDESNSIGARRYTDGRIDEDGNVWIFGGNGFDSQAQRGWLNDLWKYDPQNNTWTWMTGSEFLNTPGVFGEKGIAHSDNNPPPRYGHITWLDDSGNLWVYGGFGLLEINGTLTSGQLNDLWKYDHRTNMWTWMAGGQEFNTPAIYGTQGEFSENNLPLGRGRPQGFGVFDKSLFIFGGRESGSRSRNDFWEIKFNPGETFIEETHGITQSEFSITYDEPWARSYQVQVSQSDDLSNPFLDVNTSDSELVIDDLMPGTIYYYHIDAINEIGNSDFGGIVEVLTLPDTPSFESLELAISDLTSTQVNIDWTATAGILDGYFIDISTDPDFVDPAAVHEDYESKSIEIRQRQEVFNLEPGTRYYARLRSFNSTGTSPYSQTVGFLTKPEIPTFEEETVTSEITQSTIDLTWNPVPEILDGYKLTISTVDDGFMDIDAFLPNYDNLIISKDENTIQIRGLEPGRQYFGSLLAFNSSGDSDFSETILLITTPASPVFNLETAIETITQTEVALNWEAPPGVFDAYLLEVSTDFSFANPNLMLDGYGRGGIPQEIGESDLTHVVFGLVPGQTYFARMRARNLSGQSPNSNILEFQAVPSAPQLNDPNNITQSGASINWNAISGADVYLIDLNTSDTFASETAVFNNFPLAVPFIVIEDLNPGIRYFVRVQSSNVSGSSGEMDPSDYGITTFITIPATPVLDDVSNYTQQSFDISWPDVEGASVYIVDASDNFFQTFLVNYNELEITDNRITIDDLDPDEEYQVRVRAKNESGESENAALFDLKTLPATPIARDASNVSASVFTVNWDPAIGADYYLVEVSLDDFQTFHFNEQLASSNPVQMTNIMAGATYQYRVRAGNVSGTSPYSNLISVTAQNNAQSLNITNVDFNPEFQEGTSSTTVTVTLANGLGDPEVLLRYKGILSSVWSNLITMNGSGSTFTFDFTDAMLDQIGLEFEVYANDNVTFVESLGNIISRSFNESQSSDLPSLTFSEWQMISIPFDLENKEVTAIFNELASLEYKKQWRLMHYSEGAYADAITGFTNIEIGLGYWLNVIEQVDIDVGAGKFNTEIPYKFTVNQGWNQIGNPFNSTVSWSEVRSTNGFSKIDNLFKYDKNEKAFVESTSLEPFEGAFVFANETFLLEVSPISSGGRIVDVQNHHAEVEGSNWQLPLLLKTNQESFQIAGIGMNSLASELKDPFDQLAPPRFINYLAMVTSRKEAVYPYFRKDITPLKTDHVWEFEMSSNHLKGEVTLEWDHLELESYFNLWLVNEKTGKIVDMKTEQAHSFYLNESNHFSIHYSEEPNYTILPKNLTMGDPFPNPANTLTTIPLLLPDRDQAYEIDISIFDINGNKISTLTNGKYEAGFHLVNWDIRESTDIKNGIYFFRLSLDDQSIKPIIKKLIIKK